MSEHHDAGPPAMMRTRPRGWLPDFCRLPILFSTLLASQVAVVVIALAPGAEGGWNTGQFIAASLFAQWLALCTAVLLCKARPAVRSLPVAVGAMVAWLLPVAVAFLGSLLVHELDVALGTQLSLPPEHRLRFAAHVAGIAALLAAVLLRYFYIQEQWSDRARAQARAEVQALQARIRPHFLFNSMNMIASLVRHDPATAERVVEDLSELFRAALGSGAGEATLDEELKLCGRYLDIERLRLGNRLQAEWRIADDIPRELPMPRLLLQPLIENAVRHGVARLAAGGLIEVELSRENDLLRFSVRNPYPATEPEAAGNRHAQDSTAQRLAFRYGRRARMTVQDAGGYYLVILHIPIDQRAAPNANTDSR
jgi:two-component system, LytTR family, sensor histidine kinase AlgZ